MLAIALGGGTAAASGPQVHFGPQGHQRRVCVDTPLRLTFDRPPQLGTTGAIRVHLGDSTVVDSIDVADPESSKRTIGGAVSDTGQPHLFTYHPVVVSGDTVTVHLHQRLEYGETYYVTMDPGMVAGFPGVRDPSTWRFTTRAAPPPAGAARLTVAADGSGDFCTVQGAVDAVPLGNQRPVRIDVRAGTYDEIVYVRPDRPHITVSGQDRDRTVIRYANNDRLNGDSARASGGPADVCPLRALPTPDLHNCWRALVGVDAPDFTLENITLRNTTPYGGSQAEAFRGNNQRITLNRVTLESYQDTLRLQGTGFVTDSFIRGDVDFVWGTGSVLVQNSTLESAHAGYVTQVRNDAEHHGNVFVHNRLTRVPGVPDGSVHLGRIQTNRFPYSQAVYLDTAMDAHIAPVGWQITPDDCAQAPNLQDWEYGSTDLAGRPVDTGTRLACSRQVSDTEAARWRDPGFVLGGWVPTTVNATPTGGRGYAVSWTAAPGHAPADRIAVCRVGLPDVACRPGAPTGTAATTGTVALTLPPLPGRYEFRYLTAAGQRAATSNVVTAR
ncbi:hypothetical protein Pme01_43200 [Planosporangium mesophilum]|uniref:Pectinesterase catalytic domain-containing protein n=2 Tax=Planosporangium mesophilum TaxID=689768 RepID=A0A8J3X5F8_9ACTN|nr:hypothetical protein Pme01_43200 [Planosporangium mesophilum]